MNDLERWKEVLDSFGIDYELQEYKCSPCRELQITSNICTDGYGNNLSLIFDKETNKFIEFSPWGE